MELVKLFRIISFYSIVVNTWLHKLERCKVVKLLQERVAVFAGICNHIISIKYCRHNFLGECLT